MEELVDALADLRFRPSAHLEPERDVVRHGHVLEGGVVLEDEPDATLLWCEVGRILPRDLDLAVVCPLEPGDDPEQRRLARATRAEESRQRTALDVQRDIVDGDEVAEALGHTAHLDRHLGRLLPGPDHGHSHEDKYRHKCEND